MVPANVKDKYIIRFCVCSPKATEMEINRSWEIISKAAGK